MSLSDKDLELLRLRMVHHDVDDVGNAVVQVSAHELCELLEGYHKKDKERRKPIVMILVTDTGGILHTLSRPVHLSIDRRYWHSSWFPDEFPKYPVTITKYMVLFDDLTSNVVSIKDPVVLNEQDRLNVSFDEKSFGTEVIE